MCLEDPQWSDKLNQMLDNFQSNLITYSAFPEESGIKKEESIWRQSWEICEEQFPLNKSSKEKVKFANYLLENYLLNISPQERNYNFKNCL